MELPKKYRICSYCAFADKKGRHITAICKYDKDPLYYFTKLLEDTCDNFEERNGALEEIAKRKILGRKSEYGNP